jgi:diacylglycerol kinase (ATP)
MLIDTRGDERMRDLHQKRGGPAEQEEGLAVDAPSDAVGLEDPDISHITSVRPQTTRMLLRSFGYAFEGVAYILRTQRNARIELVVGIAAVLLAAWLGLSPVEWAVLVLTIAIVIALEWMNTALEIAVSLASPEAHPSAKVAKDVAAACVLLGAFASLVVGVLLFGARLVARFIGT